jgi:hydroxybutyrate-dimer hydrolase
VTKRLLSLFAVLAACSSRKDTNDLPSFVKGTIVKNTYDGTSNDLLTGGLGRSGLQGGAPGFANPASPTAAELRTLAIYNNYRALVDITNGGGYGVLYGPDNDAQGGRIAGDEWLAYEDDGTGQLNVTIMVQVPASFDPGEPCIVTGTSSGSRGVYGAIATAGEWGLKHGCAVAYTDKGSGMGVHDLQNDTVNFIDGTRGDASGAGSTSNFTANLSDAERASFNIQFPNRFAVKHAHSKQNPENDWGRYTLHAIEFAFYMLNEKFGTLRSDGTRMRTIYPGQTIVIAASVSNGGGAALAAAEQDTQGLISGVVAGEPQVQVSSTATIQRNGVTVAPSGRPLFDYTTHANLYQACASLSSAYSGTPAITMGPVFDAAFAGNRCASLKAKGLLTATGTTALADEALAKLNQYGWEPESNLLHLSHFSSYATPAVAVMYANAYARASVEDNLCGYSYAMVDSAGVPQAVSASTGNQNSLAQIFANGNGIPPMSTIALINNNAQNGPRRDQVSQNSTGSADYNADGVVCLRNLATGTDSTTGAPLTGAALDQAKAVSAGIQQVLRTGRLRGIPTILVQGRADALVPVNHASRAYFGATKNADGANSPTVYYEVENAQHFDAFLSFTGLAGRFIPLHLYVIRSLDLMYAALKNGAAIPPSQVVRTIPRGFNGIGLPNPITSSNVPPIAVTPGSGDLITYASGTVSIPN